MATCVSNNDLPKAEPFAAKAVNDLVRFAEIAQTNHEAMAVWSEFINHQRLVIEIVNDGWPPVFELAKPLAAFIGNEASHV